MIVVIGDVAARTDALGQTVPGGFAATVASVAASAGSKVELVTRLGEDPAGDAVVLWLARAGIGHVATLRDAGRQTPIADLPDDDARPDGDEGTPEADAVGRPAPVLEAADVGLAMRYLSDYRVVVLVHPGAPDVLSEAIAAAGWAVAHLVVVTPPLIDVNAELPASAVAISAELDADGIAERVGRYAASLDAGVELDRAYAVLTGANAES